MGCIFTYKRYNQKNYEKILVKKHEYDQTIDWQ